ncbi:MAG: hypothetical protein OEZ25_08870, partial [Candidatus Bathyarchaeota archaeon]|nr:hypothetical protein [Candidatus Bathyarchaeota archaeon]
MAFSFQAYEAGKQSAIEQFCREVGGTEEFWRNYLDFDPYWKTEVGRSYIIIGLCLPFAWVSPWLIRLLMAKLKKTKITVAGVVTQMLLRKRLRGNVSSLVKRQE